MLLINVISWRYKLSCGANALIPGDLHQRANANRYRVPSGSLIRKSVLTAVLTLTLTAGRRNPNPEITLKVVVPIPFTVFY